MEGNRDEAIRCLDLAIKARKEGDLGKCTRLANKSLRLFPTKSAERFIKEILESEQPQTENTSPPASTTNNQNNNVQQPDADTLSEINRILSCKNLYDILNIPHDATQADIKKQYRKYALRFHPDKCTAPRATDAFKAIGRSFSILSDSDKRRKYDVMGDETDNDIHHHGMHESFFSEEMDPFDLFANMFMHGDLGGGFLRNGRAYRNIRINPRNGQRVFTYSTNQRHQNHANQNQQEFHIGNILPILPLLFLLLWSLFSNFIFTDNTPYSFQRSNHHSVQRQLGGSDSYLYYVHTDFVKEYNTNEKVKQIENSVLSDLLYYYGQRCQHDIQVKKQQVYFAKLRGDSNGIREAENMTTPGCSNLKELQEIRSRG
ncbi:DnaJ subfamily B member 12-like [Oopsacas minuta]|uniref:DnaJ subfamily B member 12-like n=1 Tax=Oopsacas minuta TaxID=111878 RepID=A0AAV7KK35_9METZ|nr:DnaJ subfamily B member 12-like [Oopsacas minuta]